LERQRQRVIHQVHLGAEVRWNTRRSIGRIGGQLTEIFRSLDALFDLADAGQILFKFRLVVTPELRWSERASSRTKSSTDRSVTWRSSKFF